MKRQSLTEEVELERESIAVYKKPSPFAPPSPKATDGHGRATEDREVRNRQPQAGPPLAEKSQIENSIESFIRYQETIGRATSTVESNRVNLKYWQKYLAEQGITDLAAVTPQIVAGYQDWVYNYQTRFKRPFTIATQIQVLNNLQVFYRYLVKTGQVLGSPAGVIRLPREPRKLPAVVLTPKEMKKLLAQPDAATVLGFRDRTMYEFLYSTGIRIGELIRLRAQDISFSDGMLFVHAGKGGKDRVVPLGKAACRYVKEYLQKIRPLLSDLSTSDTLFPDRLGKPFDKSGILKKLAVYARRAGIKKRITVHTFRHTLATEMLKHGADLRQIQELLGHTNLRTTQLYTHIVKGELKRILEQCHPREQTDLPEGFVCYRGRKYLTDDERRREIRNPARNASHSDAGGPKQ